LNLSRLLAFLDAQVVKVLIVTSMLVGVFTGNVANLGMPSVAVRWLHISFPIAGVGHYRQ